MAASSHAYIPEPGVPKLPRRLLHVFPTFAVGGSQSRFAQLLKMWGQRYHHSIISLDGVLGMAERLPASAPVTYLPNGNNSRSPWRNIIQGIDTINNNRPDVLVTYNWGSFDWWVAKRFRPNLPHVHIEDGFGPEERETLLRRRCIARRVMLRERSTAIVLPSQTLYRIAQDAWSLPLRQLHYIPNGIEWERFQVDRKRRSVGRPLTIGTIATLRREKNIPRLISLFNKAVALRPSSQVTLQVIGDGDQYSHIQRLAQESPFSDRITLSGPTNAPHEVLKNIDIFALTSDTEQMPLSILEAMASSLPIISFDVGDVASMVSAENKRAASIERTNDQGFVNLLLELMDDQDKRLALGNANHAAGKARFDATRMADAYAALFG
jgi:glycosyltransferase involved in cell wall biosynthesis